MLQLGALTAEQMGVVVALGAGMLIGLERERRKGQGATRESAGLRTFMVAALLGVCAQIVSGTLAAVALLGVIALAGMSYWRSRSDDPGLTTELALITTALIGMLAVPQPELAAAAAVLLASLLAARDRLHHFATHWLSEDELHDGLLLAALATPRQGLAAAAVAGALPVFSAGRVTEALASLAPADGGAAATWADPATPDGFAALVSLTAAERRVLDHLTAGRTAAEVADLLVLSVSTVRTHIRSILRKLDVRSQLSAVAVATGRGGGRGRPRTAGAGTDGPA